VNAHERGTPRWTIDDVLARTDLAGLLDELSQPSGRLGPNRRWHCPVTGHEDHRASVSMYRDHHGHERWRCWSGDHRGDAIDLVTTTSNRDRTEAIDWLATRAGMIPDRPLPPIQPKPTPTRAQPAAVMAPVVERYVRLCASVLRGPQGEHVRQWLHHRGINDETINANLIGADPSRSVLRRQRGLPYGAAVAATFAALNPAGRITYVQARYLDPDATGRKYDNPAAALAPHPRLAFPVTTVQPTTSQLLVCEGIPDALIAAQEGFPAVAILGAQTPDESVAARIAAHATERELAVTLVCDPDAAGRRVAEALCPLLQTHDIEPRVVTPPSGFDLNEWALTDPDWMQQLQTVQRDPHSVPTLVDEAAIEL